MSLDCGGSAACGRVAEAEECSGGGGIEATENGILWREFDAHRGWTLSNI